MEIPEIRKIEDQEDGSSIYEIGPEISEVTVDETDFHRNLALTMSETSLKKLANYLDEVTKEDIESRKEWMESIKKIRKYLGFGLEDLEAVPFKESTRTFDSTFPTAVLRFVATAIAELLPQTGPAGFKIKGAQNPIFEKEGERRRDILNNYLTTEDKGFYPDFERFFLYLGVDGDTVRKVYPDSVTNKPISRFILPEDLIINSDCTSLIDSTRITHVLHLTKGEILLNKKNGLYRDVELKHLKSSEDSDDEEDDTSVYKSESGVDLTVYSKRTRYPIYEQHVILNLEHFNDSASDDAQLSIPLPYVIGRDKTSNEILYIRNNRKQNDPENKPINYFVQYKYFPGFGIFGLGLGNIMGSGAISATTILRELIDAGKFKNLPAGFIPKGFGQQQNDAPLGPGEWRPLDTGGLPLEQGFFPLPYGEPCPTLFDLLNFIGAQGQELGSIAEMGMMDSKEDISAATAYAFLEVKNRVQSTVLRSIHKSFSQELQLIDSFLNPENTFSEVEIIPVSDPSMNSTVQRIMRARATLDLAMQAPELHNLTEIFKLNYEAQGMDQRDIDKILKPSSEQEGQEALPLDPITENMNASLGMPLKAAIWQEHAAHKLAHGLYAQQYPDLQPVLMAHIKEHDAYEYLVQMQQLIGIELPSLEELQDPQVQNSIALAIAGALQDSGLADQSQQQEPIDPNALLMAEIQAKEAETAARERIANLKAETDIFKAQLDFEKEKAKIESNEDIAQLKSETELTKQEYRNG